MSEEEKCREAFESSSAELGFKLDRDLMGEYAYDDTCARWYGFRAAWHLRQQAPDGYALVPKEPTQAMLEAGEETFVPTYTGTPVSSPFLVWSAMLSAAPKPEDVK